MYSRNPSDSSHTPSHQSTHKKYLNYINFNNDPQNKPHLRSPHREPEHIPNYNLNIHPKSQNRSGTPNSASSINRNPYINPSIDSLKQPPKQSIPRNNSSKQQFVGRKSQEIVYSNMQSGNNFSKTSQGFRMNTQLYQTQPKVYQYNQLNSQIESPSYKTMDLRSVKYSSMEQTVKISSEEQILKERLKYLEVLEHSISLFQHTHQTTALQQLNLDNRQMILTIFDQINRLKEQKGKNSKTVSDLVSESDNYSDNGISESRSRLGIGIKPERRRSRENMGRSGSRQNNSNREFEAEMRLNQQLKEQFQIQIKRTNQKDTSGLDKLTAAIKVEEMEIQKLKKLNKDIEAKLNFLPFFQEWQIMCGQAEGAKKTSIKIREELAQRKQKLKQEKAGTRSQMKNQEAKVNNFSETNSNYKVPVTSTLKIPPSPMNNRNSSLYNPSNRSIPESSINVAGDRPKSINKANY